MMSVSRTTFEVYWNEDTKEFEVSINFLDGETNSYDVAKTLEETNEQMRKWSKEYLKDKGVPK